MVAPLPTILLILAAVSLGATCFMVMVAARSQREAVSAIFPIVREEERQRARRAWRSIFFWIAVTATFFGGWLATLTPTGQSQSVVAQAERSLPELEAGQSLEAAAGSAASLETTLPVISSLAATELNPSPPEEAGSDSNVGAANDPAAEVKLITPTLVPTDTPESLTSAAIYLVDPPQPAPAGARIGPIEFATEITADYRPVKAEATFNKNVQQIYAVFPFSGMTSNLNFSMVWSHNGQELLRDEGKWEWGAEARLYTFVRPQGEGLYQLDLYINSRVAATQQFEVK
ncbi:MAG TPA: hypothetical protein PKE64_05280 [Anaerolineae bacterium]|nr:hypothetical protein [Anaerolineae bacterium]